MEQITIRWDELEDMSWRLKDGQLENERLNEGDLNLFKRLVASSLSMGESWKNKKAPEKVEDPRAPKPSRKSSPRRKKGTGKRGRNSVDDYHGAVKIPVPHERCKGGDVCEACKRGRLYQLDPSNQVYFEGAPPLQAVIHALERLRCASCGSVITAREPEYTKGKKYSDSAITMAIILKYGMMMPFYRTAKCQKWMGMPVSASVLWKLVSEGADRLAPVYHALLKAAAQAEVLFVDDSHFPILSLKAENQREPDRKRNGMHTTVLVARSKEGDICLYFTGRNHAGENMKDFLALRSRDRSPPIQMSDALACNLINSDAMILALCMAHAFRKFADISHFRFIGVPGRSALLRPSVQPCPGAFRTDFAAQLTATFEAVPVRL